MLAINFVLSLSCVVMVTASDFVIPMAISSREFREQQTDKSVPRKQSETVCSLFRILTNSCQRAENKQSLSKPLSFADIVSKTEKKNVHYPPITKSEIFRVVINLLDPIGKMGPKFVGVTLDASIFRRHWKDFNVYSKPLLALAKGLAPSFLRVGGTAADFFIFNASGKAKESVVDENYSDDVDRDKVAIKNYTVTGEEWDHVNFLVQTAGWDLIFDFNEFLRQGKEWDMDNARELLEYSQQRNYNIPRFQLGNEPNAYYHNFHFNIPGHQLASDMQRLRQLLSQFPAYSNSSIIGPDVTKVTSLSADNYLKAFLQSGGQSVVAAATLHHYYFNAKVKGASVQDFVNTTVLDSLKQELEIGTSVVSSLAPGLPVWLSETSSVSGGGLANVSDGYAAGFMWLDKLGLSAEYGLQAVLRQSFINGIYSLLSQDNSPCPDYYLTVLHKRLVQGHVFNVTSTENVRVYASCANPSYNPKGAVTLSVLNVKDQPTTLMFPQFPDLSLDLYILTPGDDTGLKSTSVALNGQKLVMTGDELPPLKPLAHSGPVTFPPYSFGFIVIPKADADMCQ